MALCLAISLITRRGFVLYDQLVRYKWWYQHGYMSSIGECFDIGTATKNAMEEFMRRQRLFSKKYRISLNDLDYLSDHRLLRKFDVYCSKTDAAGNGSLMRLAPVPLFFHQHIKEAVEFSGYSGKITHGDQKAYDACRYFGALIVAALHNFTKDELLDVNFLDKHRSWFGETPICDEIRKIAQGSYRKSGGYDDGIRGKGYVVDALEAALWAFWSDDNDFEKGVLAAVNLGDDTDTTAAIYGQLAGAYYGYEKLPEKWIYKVYGRKFMIKLSKWIGYEGKKWKKTDVFLSHEEYPSEFHRSVSIDNILALDPDEVQPISQSRITRDSRILRRHSTYDKCSSESNTPCKLGSPMQRPNQPSPPKPENKSALYKLFKSKKKQPPNGTSTPKLERKNYLDKRRRSVNN